MKKVKRQGITNVMIGFLILCGTVAVLCAIMGVMVSNGVLAKKPGEVVCKVLSWGTLWVVSMAVARRKERRRFLTALILSSLFAVVCLLAGMLINGDAEIRWIDFVLTLVVGSIPGVISNTKKRRRRK